MKKFSIVNGDLSDGYHTFDELYEHRCLLFLVIARACADRFYWKPDFGGWFCLYWESPGGQISYHIPNKHLHLIEPHIERDDAHVFDGHRSADVLARLETIIKHEVTLLNRRTAELDAAKAQLAAAIDESPIKDLRYQLAARGREIDTLKAKLAVAVEALENAEKMKLRLSDCVRYYADNGAKYAKDLLQEFAAKLKGEKG